MTIQWVSTPSQNQENGHSYSGIVEYQGSKYTFYLVERMRKELKYIQGQGMCSVLAGGIEYVLVVNFHYHFEKVYTTKAGAERGALKLLQGV